MKTQGEDLREEKPEVLEVVVQKREKSGKQVAKQLRAAGSLPGIIYSKEKEPIKVQLPTNDARKFLNKVGGLSKIARVQIEDEQSAREVVVKDYQLNARRELLHVDFWEITGDTVMQSDIPIRILGTAKAVKLGGVMQVIRRAIPVKCAVKHLPDFVDVVVDDLNFGESVHVLDIPYPEGVKPVVLGRNFTLLTITGRAPEVTEEAEGEEA